jgi:hypothetical protein
VAFFHWWAKTSSFTPHPNGRYSHMGLVLASLYMSILYITNLTIIEAYVDWKAVIFGRDLGLQNVIMKGNTPKIVHIFQTEDQLWYK